MKLLWLLVVTALCLTALTPIHAQEDDDDLDIVEEDFADAEPMDEEEQELKVPVLEKPKYSKPTVSGNAFLVEPFDSQESFSKRWVKSQAKKDDTDEEIAKYDGVWSLEESEQSSIEGDLGLVLKSRAKHHAISAKLDKPYEFKGKPFIVQYEVQFQTGQECGGAYIKLLTQDPKFALNNFMDKTPYTIMFGPDKCGNDDKLHFIFRHKNPVNGQFEEKHAKKPSASLSSFFTDKKTHLFTLIIQPDNTFEVLVDNSLVNQGSLLEDMDPAVNPPKEIVDPEDKKPEDWDEREKIPDPDATKPDDWDETEPAKVDDPDAVKPEGWLDDEEELVPDEEADKPADWDDDMDGDWEPPLVPNPKCEDAPGCGEYTPPKIDNPKYKGKWKAPLIDNPNYKGKWKPRNIPNPDFFEDLEPYKMTSIGAVGIELWSMSNDIYFDNIIITDDKSVAEKFAAETWEIKQVQELAAKKASGRSVVDAVMDATNERPWLWAVFIFVIVLPIVLIIAYCCMPSKADDIAAAKKSDAPQPDDKETDDEDKEKEKEEEESGAGDAAKPKASPKKAKKASKSDLDANEGDEADADVEEDEDSSDKPATRSSPRKRATKARKD